MNVDVLGSNDGVTCFYCGNTLTDWSTTIHDTNKIIVQLEHARFFPCRFIRYLASEKFIANTQYFHAVSDEGKMKQQFIILIACLLLFLERQSCNPMMSESVITFSKPQSIDECLLTFKKWPSDATISAKDLALAGFYYLGDELRVECYMCDLQIDEWHDGMVVFDTHKHRQNNCEIIQMTPSIVKSDFKGIDEKWRLQIFHGLSFGTDYDQRLCQELGACGFYHVKDTDDIRCAYCTVLIKPKRNLSIMSNIEF
ncbi:unnamed protein product [Rotaria sp. Silwood1]|nr:unnamed protein product [Rotaria sp. Silwood1]